MNNTDSKDFEKQIKRIHDVLVQDSGIVTWNDKIPDPDNPRQSRQIDITVRTKGKIFHIECRDHQKPQDTKWVEELYGRKISLNADAMIGVSSSGFTEGALKKANRLGVFVCDLNQINENTIQSFGERTLITFTYYKFSNLEIGLYLRSILDLPLDKLKSEVLSKVHCYDILFNQIKCNLSQNIDFSFPYGFNIARIECSNVSLFGREVIGMSVRGDVNKETVDYECPSMWIFQSEKLASLPLAFVEKSDNLDIEIIKSMSGFSSVTLDLSFAPQPPPNSVFYGIEFSKLPGSKNYPPKFNIIGSHEHPFRIEDASFIIADIKS